MDDEIIYGFPERKELDVKWLKRQLRSGASISDIVKLTGYSSHYINKTIKELGLNTPRQTVSSIPKKKPTPKKQQKVASRKQHNPTRKTRAAPAKRKYRSIEREWLKKQLDAGIPIAEIARQSGYSRFGVYYNIDKYKLKIPEKEIIDPEWLRTQKMLGKTDAEIAEEFGFKHSTVRYCRKKYGIDSFVIKPLEKE